MSCDPGFKKMKYDRAKQRYLTDQGYREGKIETAKQKSKERYDNNKDYRNEHKKKIATRIMGKYRGDKSYNENEIICEVVPKNA
jgi:hypothetical protein